MQLQCNRTHAARLRPDAASCPLVARFNAEDNIAKEIEAIYTNAGGDLHTFDSKRGLVISKDEPDEPTAKALACLAKCSGTPYMVVSEVTVGGADQPLCSACTQHCRSLHPLTLGHVKLHPPYRLKQCLPISEGC